ncbi:MAG: hypothetical protein R3C49_23295 [Planctomycetaceae bacterium]
MKSQFVVPFRYAVSLLLVSGMLACVQAQDVSVPLSPLMPVLPMEAGGSADSVLPGEPVIIDGHSDGVSFSQPVASADTGYWFVNTHHSPQDFDSGLLRFCPGVLRYECGQGFRQASFEELLAGIEPGLPVCIMIHGSFVDTPSTCHESHMTWQWLRSAACGARMQMIYFHWPSYRPLTPLVPFDTNQLGRRAARNGFYVAELIHHLPPDCPVCLLGHSHGTRVISSAMHLMAGGAVQGYCHPFARVNGRPIRAVFAGAAIDHHWYNPGQRYDRSLHSVQCVLNMTNCVDPALAVYPLRMPLLVRRSLGTHGLSNSDRRQLGPISNKVLDYDVTRAIGASHLWPYYFTNPGLAMLMRNYVYFPDLNPQQTAPLIMNTASADSVSAR